jgi:hypothetical protein
LSTAQTDDHPVVSKHANKETVNLDVRDILPLHDKTGPKMMIARDL